MFGFYGQSRFIIYAEIIQVDTGDNFISGCLKTIGAYHP